MWSKAKKSGIFNLAEDLLPFVDVDELDDEQIDQVQEIVENVADENTNEDDADCDENIFPENVEVPLPQSSKIDPILMQSPNKI